jgi:hypothetical protein
LNASRLFTALAFLACGPTRDAAPPPVLSPDDASVTSVDASGAPAPDATADVDADAETSADVNATAAEPDCARRGLALSHHIVRGRVVEARNEQVPRGQRHWDVDWAEIDITEIIYGDLAGVSPAYRKGFYAASSRGFCDPNPNPGGPPHCGFGSHGIASDLQPHKGEELIFVLTLPGDHGGQDETIAPTPMRLRYGRRAAHVAAFCPLDQKDALVAAKKRMSRPPP